MITLREKHYQAVVLLLVYFVLRLLFQQLPELKSIFIYPTGWVVESFYGSGRYVGSEWIYYLGKNQFVLGETCSGTTFFSLLFSYLIYRMLTLKVSWLWLVAAYPITLIANSMRVLSSMYAHNYLTILGLEKHGDSVHIMTGTVTFLTCFLIIAYFIEKGRSLNETK